MTPLARRSCLRESSREAWTSCCSAMASHQRRAKDHSIIELIVNNRTAIVGYAKPPGEQSTGVRLFGAGLRASMDYWVLDAI